MPQQIPSPMLAPLLPLERMLVNPTVMARGIDTPVFEHAGLVELAQGKPHCVSKQEVMGLPQRHPSNCTPSAHPLSLLIVARRLLAYPSSR